jgi:hypothetical protein
MTRRILFSIDELVASVGTLLEPYLGAAAYCIEGDSLILGLLEIYCYGECVEYPTPDRFLSGFEKIPRDVRAQITAELQHRVCQQIGTAFGYITPSCVYCFESYAGGLLMTESAPTANVALDDDTTPEQNADNGDYVPERLRRSKHP